MLCCHLTSKLLDGKINHPWFLCFPLSLCKACCGRLLNLLLAVVGNVENFLHQFEDSYKQTGLSVKGKDLKNVMKSQLENLIKINKPWVHCEALEVTKAWLICFIDCYHLMIGNIGCHSYAMNFYITDQCGFECSRDHSECYDEHAQEECVDLLLLFVILTSTCESKLGGGYLCGFYWALLLTLLLQLLV